MYIINYEHWTLIWNLKFENKFWSNFICAVCFINIIWITLINNAQKCVNRKQKHCTEINIVSKS